MGGAAKGSNDLETKISGSLLFLSGLVFFVFNTISESLYPNYDPKTNALSDLGAVGAPTRYLWDGQLLVSGVVGLVGIYLLFYRSNWGSGVRRRRLTGIFYFLPAVGMTIVSLFPENYNILVHTLGAFLTFLFGGVSAVYAYRLTKPPFRYLSVILGLITLISTFALGSAETIGFGLVERLVVYPFGIWSVAFGIYLMGLSTRPNA